MSEQLCKQSSKDDLHLLTFLIACVASIFPLFLWRAAEVCKEGTRPPVVFESIVDRYLSLFAETIGLS